MKLVQHSLQLPPIIEKKKKPSHLCLDEQQNTQISSQDLSSSPLKQKTLQKHNRSSTVIQPLTMGSNSLINSTNNNNISNNNSQLSNQQQTKSPYNKKDKSKSMHSNQSNTKSPTHKTMTSSYMQDISSLTGMISPRQLLSNMSSSLMPKKFFASATHQNLLLASEKLRLEDAKQDQQEQDLLIKKMDETFEIEIADNKPKKIIGETAIKDYYSHYKKASSIKEYNRYFKVQDTFHTAVHVHAEEQQVLPSKLGIIKSQGNEEVLEINKMRFGDKYFSVISQGLIRNNNINQFQLAGNRISQDGAQNILHQISKKARYLDLAQNEIGRLGCEHIGNTIKSTYCKLEYLNLEDNKLGDSTINQFLLAMQTNTSIKKLNLSKNYISDKNTDGLRQLVEYSTIQELYLHWNQLKAHAGQQIFEGLLDNERLKVLDLSCNALGSNGDCSEAISKFLEHNTQLVHLDLSINAFDYDKSLKISQALEKNHTIYGFHYAGNVGYVDSRQFLVVNEYQNKDLTGTYLKRRINSCSTLGSQTLRNKRDYDLIDVCWICEGWNEVQFVWDQEKSGQTMQDPLFIHFNFEDFKANYTGPPENNQFTYKRMIPPGELLFFFSQFNNVFANSQTYLKKNNPEGHTLTNVMNGEEYFVDIELRQVNGSQHQKMLDFMIGYKPQCSLKPRVRDPKYKPPKKKKEKIIWSFPISLMYKWRPDDTELLRRCFEFDWNNILPRLQKIIKNDKDLIKVKIFFQSKYQLIKDIYKFYASQNPVNDIWGIQAGPFLELVEELKLVSKSVSQADIDLKWTATIAGGQKGNPRNPERSIVRYQMMEIMVRLADELYLQKNKIANTIDEALTMFWNDHCDEPMHKYNQQEWRNNIYWTEDCDYCLKHYKRIIDHIYKNYSLKKVKPGQQQFMCLDELLSLLQHSGIAEEGHVGSSLGYYAFNLSMMTQIDELNSDKIFQMNQVEFYEALARIADEASLPPHSTLYPDVSSWTIEQRQSLPLGQKIEGLMLKLLQTCCEPQFIQTYYPPITKSFFCKNEEEDEDEIE